MEIGLKGNIQTIISHLIYAKIQLPMETNVNDNRTADLEMAGGDEHHWGVTRAPAARGHHGQVVARALTHTSSVLLDSFIQ